MTKKSIFIIEDEPHSLELTTHFLSRMGSIVQLVGTSNNLKDGLDEIQRVKPDILILDLMVNNDFGLDIINNETFRGEVIILSAHSEYGILAIKKNVCDYLLKPLVFKELESAISKAVKKTSEIQSINQDYKIVVHDKMGMRVLGSSEILYFEADGNYCQVHTKEKVFIVSYRLGEIFVSLPTDIFVRVHKSFVVNLVEIDVVLKYNKGVLLKNGVVLPTSRRFKI